MQLPQGALEILERGGMIVAANARAARDLRRLFGEQQQATGRKAWASPAILDFHGWLAAEWQRLLLTGTEQRLLLNPLQEESVWAEIVLPVVKARSLLSPGEVARLAQRAFASLVAYGGLERLARDARDHRLPEGDDPLEQELFRGWARAFTTMCERRGWLSSSQWPWVLAHAYRDGRLSVPPSMGWCGFDRLTPADSALREALKSAACDTHDLVWALHAEATRVTAQTMEEELEACALWVRDTLTPQPGAHIGVLAPDVAAVRPALEKTFRHVLMPASRGLRDHPEKLVYEFTLGISLADVPMVRAALLLLRWMTAPLEREEISWLMTTGFFGNPGETTSLAAEDARRRQKDLLPPEEEMESLLQRLGRSASSAWLRSMRRARAGMEPLLSRERSFRQWVVTVDASLAAAGWPGAETNDSVLYQARERWQRALREVAALDFAEARISYDRFLNHLNHHAQASIFSAASQDAPVSISGIPESAGRTFDAVWVLQATDEALPARSSPLAMLPLWLQKDLRMPRGDAREDSAFCTAMLERLQASTRALIFSYAREGPLGAQRPAAPIAGLREEFVSAKDAGAPVMLTELFEDVGATPWPAGALASGGAKTLKMQGACPFQAFAAKRLGAQDIRDAEHGFDPRVRGTLLHTVLQTVWSDERLQDHAGLQQVIFSHQLAVLVTEHVDAALARFLEHASAWEVEYIALEKHRLCQLVQDWLIYESGRTPFVVEQIEAKQEIEIAGLRLSVRMDRVDRLEQGRILIDYKTGDAKWKHWTGERPEEPQLPLYALAGKVDELRDIYFARVRPVEQERKFVGAVFGDACGLIADTKPLRAYGSEANEQFQSLRSRWQQALENISHEFQAGIATVSPKEGGNTCQYCAFGGLCRVAEVAGLDFVAEDEA